MTHVTTSRATWSALALGALALGWAGSSLVQAQGPPPARFLTGDPRVAIRSLPFEIATPGSYYLVGDLEGAVGASGIIVDADDVTLDLGGFRLLGVPGSLDGVVAVAGRSGIRVHSGTVRGWGEDGVDLGNAEGCQVADLRCVANGRRGIAAGLGAQVRDCSARDNGLHGVEVLFGSTVAGCVATGNAFDGLVAQPGATSSGCVLRDSSARGNGGTGISAGDGTVVESCSSNLNGGPGVLVANGSTVRGCAVALNSGGGVVAFSALVHSNAVVGNANSQINAVGSTVLENHE